jgi:hypothetical protein
MTTPRLVARVDKLGARKMQREMAIEIQDGESREDLMRRIAACRDGRPRMAMPRVCATSDEWIEQCRRHGYPARRQAPNA